MNSYATILRDSQRARWSLDDVVGRVGEIDYGDILLPEGLVRAQALDFLGAEEQRLVNHIRSHSYLRLFALVERFILPFAVMHAGRALHDSHEELLALMQFGEEEAKHIALFERFSEAFELGFGCFCEIVGDSRELVGRVLAEDPLAVALLVLHIEWMTQEHYLRSVKDSSGGDASFAYLLRCHWVEEAQHARIDTLLIQSLASGADEAQRARALDGYLGLVGALDDVLRQQVELDIEAFSRAGGRLSDPQRDLWRERQALSYHDAFLASGLRHRRLRQVVDRHIQPSSAPRLDAQTTRYSWPVAS